MRIENSDIGKRIYRELGRLAGDIYACRGDRISKQRRDLLQRRITRDRLEMAMLVRIIDPLASGAIERIEHRKFTLC